MKLLYLVILVTVSGVLSFYTPSALSFPSGLSNRAQFLKLSLVEKQEVELESASSRIAEISRSIIEREISATPLPTPLTTS